MTTNTHPSRTSNDGTSSLVQRVMLAIDSAPVGTNNSDEARAAIREVAAWMREQQDGDLIAATLLEREIER